MATLYTQQSKNISKTWLLMGLFLVFITAIGYLAGFYYGNANIFYGAVIFSVLMNIVGYWNSDKIALAMAGAIPLNAEIGNPEAGIDQPDALELKRVVENLSITAGLPVPKLYIINDQAPNAFATGRNKNHAAIAVTTGLLHMMNRAELEGVLAHEMSHIGNRDTLLSTVVVILVGLISIASDMMLHSGLYGGGFGRKGGDSSDSNDKGQIGAIIAIVGVVLIILSPFIAMLIQLAISRRREFLADATGALMTRYPQGLADALTKIENYSKHGGTPLSHASNATAHLYIMNPFGAKTLKGLHKLFMTHPPTEERIKALVDMK